MKLRAVVFGALVIAATVAVPAAAEAGIHVSRGATDSFGCYAIEVWNGDVLVRTIPATRESDCATLGMSALLPSGILVFGVRHNYGLYGREIVLWASDGTADGTTVVGGVGGWKSFRDCDEAWQIVGRSAYISQRCTEDQILHPYRRHARHPGINLVPSAGYRPERMAGVRRAPWPHLLQRHGQDEGPRAVGEQRHTTRHPRREGHPAGRTWLVSPAPVIGRHPTPVHRG